MAKTKNYLVVVFMALVGLISCLVIYLQRTDDEGKVYLAFLASYKDTLHDVAFYSQLTDCNGASSAHMSEVPAELFANYLEANDRNGSPVDLHMLYGYFNVVSYEDAKRIHHDPHLQSKSTNKRLIGLSRVGFDRSQMNALFCIDYGGGGALVHLIKDDSNWTVVKTRNVWVR